MTLKHLRAVIAFALLALALHLAPARATVDNAICSTADAGATCSGTETITSANEEIADLRKSARMWLTSVAGTNTITATSSPVITSYQAGQCWLLKPAANNTGAVTLNIATIGAKSLLSSSGGALGSGDIQSTTIYDVCYYASNDDFRILGPLGTGFATASAAYITQASSGSLSAERVLTDGTCIDSTDGGANSTFTIAVGTCTSANLATAVTDETGSGAAVFATSPTLVTPALGTPSSATLTNATGLPISTGVSGLGTGVATALGTPSSANLRSAVTDETGTGALMFGLTTAMSDDLSCTGSQVVRRNAGDTAFECATPTGGGDALTTNPLSQFAATTSAQLAGVISDETGSGALVFGTSPSLTTPTLGVASATTVNKVTITAPATGSTLTIPDGVTLTGPAASGTAMTLNNTETVTGVKTFGSAGAVGRLKIAGTTSGSTTLDASATASGTLTLPAATDTLVGKDTTDTLTNKSIDLTSNTLTSTSAQLATALTNETGSGSAVFATSPTLVTPALGTPSAAVLTNATGLPLSTGVTGALGIANGGLGAAFTDPNADQLMFWDDSAAAIAGIVTLSGAAISGTTLTINDVTCTDCLGATEIADLVLGTDTSGNYVSGLAAGTGLSVSHTPAEGSTGTYSFDFSDAGASPSLGADECRFTSNATVGGHIVCEGDTADAFESRISFTDPTADRLLTIPNADTVTVQGTTCSGTDKVSAINASTGAVTCSTDQGGAGSGDNVTVNGVAVADIDLDDADPAAPTGGYNIKWQLNTTPSPDSVSAYLDITGATDLTAPAVGDTFLMYDLSATAPRELSLGDTFKVIDGLTEDTSPDQAADFIPTYDTSATSAKKIKPSKIGAGKKTIWVPATAMIARTTNGCAAGTVEMTTNKQMVKTCDFDTTTQEFAQFSIQMPKSWDESTVLATFAWSHASTATNFGVVWALEGYCFSDDDALDAAWGTAQQVADTGGTTNDLYRTPATAAITLGGTPAAEDVCYYQVKRVPADASDTMAIDARLHGVMLTVTTDTNTDN